MTHRVKVKAYKVEAHTRKAPPAKKGKSSAAAPARAPAKKGKSSTRKPSQGSLL